MNFIKFILFLLGTILGVWLLFQLLGFISGLLWYIIWIGLIGVVGYAGYKVFIEKDKDRDRLEGKTPTPISDFEKFDRVLEEYKRKELNK